MDGNSRESKKLKRSHAVDRLSRLPDNVIHHILSFLDTKSLVRTSLLSRKWRSLWKHVPVLNFVQRSFPNLSSFTKHVHRILSTRYRSVPVSSITFNIRGDKWAGAMKTFEKIVKHAGSHGGGGGLHHLSFIYNELKFSIRDVTNVITASHHQESLKTLKLGTFTFEREFDSHFKLLTTLELSDCLLKPCSTGEPFDPFGNLPCLNYLKLVCCSVSGQGTGIGLIISGLELLDLQIKRSSFGIYEVIAPKLKSLYLLGDDYDPYVPKLNLPALDHANIRLVSDIPYGYAELKGEYRRYMDFLGALRNVECLLLHFDEAIYGLDEEGDFPLNRIKALIKPETPPFTRLKTLKMQFVGLEKLPNIHYEVIRYFFEGSLSTEEKLFQLELVTDKQY
ncbi:unnamed protein product [Linum tenue]|uniref:F-box domain-containing protein n=1 Tax=Linum tenue TaxID=586396 RepID=A0AAV0GUP5_9ROSI|nr:unnamed protein product [Linum tenue]